MCWIEKMKEDLKMSGLMPETCESYLRKITVFLREISIPPKQLSLDDALLFLRMLRYDRNYCIGTVNNYRSALKYFYEVTLEKQWSDKKIPRLRGYVPLPSVLSQSEVIAFIEAMPDLMFRTVLYTMYASGLRVGEVVALKVRDIDSKRMQIYVAEGKNGHARYAILSAENLEQLRYFVRFLRKQHGYRFEPNDYLFPSRRVHGNHISKKTIKNNITKLAKRQGMEKHMTAHTLRHCFATHLLENGVELLQIKELLGHRCLKSTSVYLHLASFSKLGIQSPLDRQR
jgi:site-specific recombinase XerD